MATPNVSATSQIKTRTGIITAAGALLAANLNRSGLIIQNLNGTDPLYVCFGGTASKAGGVFDLILKAGAAPDDGLGGTFSPDGLCPTSAITVDGNSVRVTATEW